MTDREILTAELQVMSEHIRQTKIKDMMHIIKRAARVMRAREIVDIDRVDGEQIAGGTCPECGAYVCNVPPGRVRFCKYCGQSVTW